MVCTVSLIKACVSKELSGSVVLFGSPGTGRFPAEQWLQELHVLTQLLLDGGDVFWSC